MISTRSPARQARWRKVPWTCSSPRSTCRASTTRRSRNSSGLRGSAVRGNGSRRSASRSSSGTIRPYTKRREGPELVAVLQPEYQRVGKISGLPLRLDPERDFGTVRRPRSRRYSKKERRRRSRSGPRAGFTGSTGVARNRVVSVFGCEKTSGQVRVKVVASKNNIYVGVPV